MVIMRQFGVRREAEGFEGAVNTPARAPPSHPSRTNGLAAAALSAPLLMVARADALRPWFAANCLVAVHSLGHTAAARASAKRGGRETAKNRICAAGCCRYDVLLFLFSAVLSRPH